MSFTTLRWLFPLAVTLHNAEEAASLPDWAARHTFWLPLHPGATRIRLGLLLLTAASYLICWMSVRTGRQSVWTYLLFGYAAAMLANVLAPHLVASLAFRAYTPGLATAVLVNLPLMTGLMVQAVRQQWVVALRARRYALGVSITLAGAIAALFTLPV